MTEVTIIIPNYNGKKLLENCIKTLERQTCQEFKLLVIDNGSKDGSTDVTLRAWTWKWSHCRKIPDFVVR